MWLSRFVRFAQVFSSRYRRQITVPSSGKTTLSGVDIKQPLEIKYDYTATLKKWTSGLQSISKVAFTLYNRLYNRILSNRIGTV
jgi:hypothetical protein